MKEKFIEFLKINDALEAWEMNMQTVSAYADADEFWAVAALRNISSQSVLTMAFPWKKGAEGFDYW